MNNLQRMAQQMQQQMLRVQEELETAQVLRPAIALYERAGFQRQCASPHACRCDARYALDL